MLQKRGDGTRQTAIADAGLREDFLAAGGAADFTVSLLAEEAPEDETSVPGANDFGFEGER